MIAIVMTTYVPNGKGSIRAEYAKMCIYALSKRLHCSQPIRLIVTDDCSPNLGAFLDVVDFASEYLPTTSCRSEHKGIGHSINRAMEVVGYDNWMYITDDWLLTDELDLDPAVALFEKYDYDIVRLGPIHPNLSCTTKFDSTLGWWLDISNKEGFAFGTRPFLATPKLITKYGPFKEGVNAYEAERLYNETLSKTNIKIAQLGSISLSGPWKHIGEFEVGDYDIGISSGRPI